MTKTNCIDSLSAALNSASRWRLSLDERYPDCRNAYAARKLSKLAGEVSNLTDEQFGSLDFESARWYECLRQTARLVGYAHKKMSLSFFVRCLAGGLSAPGVAA